MIGLNPIYIDNNIPCSYNNNTVSMLRSDGSSFLLIATGNSSNGINEYLYVEYNKSNMFDLKNQCFDNFNPSLFSNTINKERYNANVSPKENIEIIKIGFYRFRLYL